MDVSSDNLEQDDLLRQAEKFLADGAQVECLSLLRANWLSHPEDGKTVDLLAKLMKDLGRPALTSKLEKLAASLMNVEQASPAQKPSTEELFEAAFALIDVREHELAIMLLKQCIQLAPKELIFNYELGFALMSLRRFNEALPYFEAIATSPADFDTLLNLAACYTMTRQPKKASDVLKQLEQLKLDEEQTRELHHRRVVLKRLETVAGKTVLSSRDWLYVLYGSILLRENNRPDTIKEEQLSISTMLAILKGVLVGIGIELEAIEYYGLQSRPLAIALAELLEVPASIYKGPDRSEEALLAMTWASDIIGPHESFRPNKDLRTIFAYALTWDEPLPLVPEIVGCLAYDEPMPWHQATSSFPSAANSNPLAVNEFDHAVEISRQSILSNARNLESEPSIIHQVQELIDYYSNKKSLLLIGNAGTFPYRSEYTAELP